MKTHNRQNPRRRGFSYLEVQAAFAVLGIALAGLAPIVVAQLRLMARIEARLPSNRIVYLVPPANPWSAKLGAAARRTLETPSESDPTDPPTFVNVATVESVESSATDDTATVVVSLTPIEGSM